MLWEKVKQYRVLYGNPADTRRRFNVYKTSIRRRPHCVDVLYMLKRRRVSAGKQMKGYREKDVVSNAWNAGAKDLKFS